MRAIVLILLVAAITGCVAQSAPTASQAADTQDHPPVDCLASVGGLDLHAATIPDIHAAYASGALTVEALLDAYEARYLAFDEAGPTLNSIQTLDPTAWEYARVHDERRASGSPIDAPLAGIPILLKDNIAAGSVPVTAGSIALAENMPAKQATIASRIEAAGGILFGKAQLSEFANWVSLNMPNGYSSLGGQVVNAYTMGDPSGSSAGSGVAGSMAFATITIGTETSGSILSPSIANSLVGLKPTMGLVSRAGIIPLAPSFDVPGPMGRNVWDVALVLGAIAGPDPRDPITDASEGRLPPNSDYTSALGMESLQGVRLGYVEGTGGETFARAKGVLESLGAELVPIERGDADSVSLTEIGLIFNEFKASLNAYLANEAGDAVDAQTLTDIILYNQQHPDKVKYGQDLLIASDTQPGLMPLVPIMAAPTIAASRATADELFAQNGGVDAIIGQNAPFTNLGAAAGYPTIVVPAGYDGNEPVGLSFFGQAFSEDRLLAYAHAYEQASRERVPPHVINPSLLTGVCGGDAAAPDASAETFEAKRAMATT